MAKTTLTVRGSFPTKAIETAVLSAAAAWQRQTQQPIPTTPDTKKTRYAKCVWSGAAALVGPLSVPKGMGKAFDSHMRDAVKSTDGTFDVAVPGSGNVALFDRMAARPTETDEADAKPAGKPAKPAKPAAKPAGDSETLTGFSPTLPAGMRRKTVEELTAELNPAE